VLEEGEPLAALSGVERIADSDVRAPNVVQHAAPGIGFYRKASNRASPFPACSLEANDWDTRSSDLRA
jgi:hypothetical protein